MSQTTTHSNRRDIKPGHWRISLESRIGRLRIEARSLEDSTASGEVLKHLSEADSLAKDRQNFVEAWSGSQVEKAWTELRLAEESLVGAASNPEAIHANAASALSHAKGRVSDADPMVVALNHALSVPAEPTAIKAHTLKVLMAAHEVSDEQHRAQREFRNRLRSLTIGLAVLALVVAFFGLLELVPDGWIPVPAGITRGDALVAALVLGAGGALFSAVPSLSQAPDNSTTFNPVIEQALLKIVVGAYSAVVGLVAVAAGIPTISGDGNHATPAGFAMMCAAFGAAQEAITRFADKKAADTQPTTTT